MEKKLRVKISKLLSYALRHRPEKFNIILDKNGWVTVQDLLNNCRKEIKFDFQDLKEVVENCDKQRFQISEDGSKIRANQGHSVKVDLGLTPIIPPQYLYHGTAERFFDSIKKEGLKKMNRHDVHLYEEKHIKKARNTGERHQKGSRGLILVINAAEMIKDGFVFYKTENEVYLTDSVPNQYITKQEINE